MSATTRLANYSRKAVQTQRAARTVRRVAPVARKAITYRRFAENSNKIHHLFGRSGHKFAPFLKKFRGNKTKAYNSIYNATFNYAKINKINGVFEKTLKISGYNVTVRR